MSLEFQNLLQVSRVHRAPRLKHMVLLMQYRRMPQIPQPRLNLPHDFHVQLILDIRDEDTFPIPIFRFCIRSQPNSITLQTGPYPPSPTLFSLEKLFVAALMLVKLKTWRLGALLSCSPSADILVRDTDIFRVPKSPAVKTQWN